MNSSFLLLFYINGSETHSKEKYVYKGHWDVKVRIGVQRAVSAPKTIDFFDIDPARQHCYSCSQMIGNIYITNNGGVNND